MTQYPPNDLKFSHVIEIRKTNIQTGSKPILIDLWNFETSKMFNKNYCFIKPLILSLESLILNTIETKYFPICGRKIPKILVYL